MNQADGDVIPTSSDKNRKSSQRSSSRNSVLSAKYKVSDNFVLSGVEKKAKIGTFISFFFISVLFSRSIAFV
jgi:hypothetical protein